MVLGDHGAGRSGPTSRDSRVQRRFRPGEEAANILDAASNPGGPPRRSSTQSIATDDQALALHSDVNFSRAPLRLLVLIDVVVVTALELARYPALTTEIFLVEDLETEYIYCDPCLVQFRHLDPLFENLFKA
ncbi:hypothetical protein SUGI_0448620 [Cryptomeria japonica]|nr:hypothetical protein SUGI_0448620 [Cryptomeria japonica]